MTPKDIATVKAALDLLHEIKAQLRTHVEFDHATRLMAAVGDMAEAARAYLETALSSPPAAPTPDNNGWRDISTAPRDGTVFIAYEDNDAVYACQFHNEDDDGRIVWNVYCGQPAVYGAYPTHWRPLPPPPALDKGE